MGSNAERGLRLESMFRARTKLEEVGKSGFKARIRIDKSGFWCRIVEGDALVDVLKCRCLRAWTLKT